MSLLRPVPGKVTQPFLGTFSWERGGYVKTDAPCARGKRTKFAADAEYRTHVHLAIDYNCATGTPILAVKSGTIIGQGKDSSGALFVYQRLRVGTNYQVVALYYHLSAFSHAVGAQVTKGGTVALSGNSGFSTAPHLHFEIIRADRGASVSQIYASGLRLDPQPFIDGTVTLARVAP